MDEQYQMQVATPPEGWDKQFANDMSKSIDVLLNDENVDNKILSHPIWALTSKTAKITFLDKNDVHIMEALQEAMLCKYYRSVPPCMHNNQMYQFADQIRVMGMLNLRRSSGSDNSNKLNERTALVTQIKQSNSMGGGGSGGSSVKPGLFSRLFGRR